MRRCKGFFYGKAEKSFKINLLFRNLMIFLIYRFGLKKVKKRKRIRQSFHNDKIEN